MSLYESEDSNDENYINRYLSIKPKKKINREIFNIILEMKCQIMN